MSFIPSAARCTPFIPSAAKRTPFIPSVAKRSRGTLVVALISALLGPSCAHEATSTSASGKPYCPYGAANDGTQSYDILCREPVANRVKVKHVLLRWREIYSEEHPLDPAEAARKYVEAQQLAKELLSKLQAGEPIEPMMKEYSADPGSARTGIAYEATPSASLVSMFKSLSMRLNVREAGIVKTSFGLHVIQRIE